MAPVARIWSEGSELFEKLRSYYFGKKQEEAPPLISKTTAFSCAALFTALYVLPFYISPVLRTSPLNSRDAPTVIKARIRAVGLSCFVSGLITIYILAVEGHATPWDVVRLLGLWPITALDCIKVLSLTGILFAGPLYEALLIDGGWRQLTFANLRDNTLGSWTGWRNNVVAPISEEIVFRSMVISLCLLAKVPPGRIVFVSPLIFGGAHIHHFFEFVQARKPAGRVLPPFNVLAMGLVRSLFQFAYTSVFGFFAAFVYLRTGNLLAVILTHSFCNIMGFPRLWGRVGQYGPWEGHQHTPDVAQGKRDDSLDGHVRVGNGLMEEGEKRPPLTLFDGPKSLGVGWTMIYYVLIGAGAYSFRGLLWVLTESSHALATV